MSAIIPFESGSKLPAYLKNRTGTTINKDVLSAGSNFPVLSIKGKAFTLVKGSEKKLLTRNVDGDEEAVQSLQLAVVRANTKARTFYATAYSEEESQGAKPTCFSYDGITPSAAATTPQAKKCQGCPKNVWGVKDGKGYDCQTNTRLAVIDPEHPSAEETMLLRVPPASRKLFAQAVEAGEKRGVDYNALVLKVSFDKEAPSPKLLFKPVGFLDDATYEIVSKLYDDDLIKEIVGAVDAVPSEHEEGGVDTSELDAAIAAKKAVETAKGKAEAAPKVTKAEKPAVEVEASEIEDAIEKPVKAEKAEKPAKTKAAPKPAPAADDDLLGDLDSLLGNIDD